MILVDTSIWVDHLRRANSVLAGLLENGEVLSHPFIAGELLLGSASQHAAVFASFARLPQAQVARDDEVFEFIVGNRLSGSGVGYVDAHLLAATRLTEGARLWTGDRRLSAAAQHLGLVALPS